MEQNDKSRFAEIMMGIADNFGGQISREGLLLRFDSMSTMTIDQVARAGSWLVRNREEKFPAVPTVKEFFDALKTIEGNNVSVKSEAEAQVDIVLKKLRYEGRNAAVDFEHPVTFHLMTTRWRYNTWAAEVFEKDLVWFRKEFIEAFEAATEVRQADEMKLLSGPDRHENVVMLESIAKKIGKAV